jgi:hypothetical protein
MSHTYLIDLYDLIDKRLEEVESESKKENLDAAMANFLKGRADSLREFKQFLASRYNSKLPRRIRGKYH